jgi:ketosteroid isomerase-like protein
MFEALVEEATPLAIVLVLVSLGLVLAWRQTRRRAFLAGVGVGVALLVVLLLLVLFVTTDNQRIEKVIRDMADAVHARDVRRIYSHLAPNFSYRRTDRDTFRDKTAEAIQQQNAESVEVWAFDHAPRESGQKTARVTFTARPRGHWAPDEARAVFRVQADMVLEADGEWRLQTFEVFRPLTKEPIGIPGF